jgi:2-oxoglutarate ferredoxin oxidoreductase subunit alpha
MAMSAPSVLIRIGGEGGEGVISTGDLLSRAASRSGLSIMTYRTFPAEIKGGLAQFQMKLSTEPLLSIGLNFDYLMAFNQEALDSFHRTVFDGGTIFYDPAECKLDGINENAERVAVPLSELAKEKGGSLRGKNMVALGFLGSLAGLDLEVLRGLVTEKFGTKGGKVLDANIASLEAGHEHGQVSLDGKRGVGLPLHAHADRENTIVISGNEATTIGAIAAGCRFMAGYPITPASSILELASRQMPRFGGTVVQAEDEIAALAACIGASFAGKKAMTATSGPGLMLMTELITLASTQELPVVVIDVQRAGPSTGMPTKQEQSDLKFAIYGTAGEAPKIVMAPTSVRDCFYEIARAFALAETYQLPVLFLSDTSLGVRTETIAEPLVEEIPVVDRLRPTREQLTEYKRYLDTPTGVSPLVDPGTPGGLYISSGLEHDEAGSPCYTPAGHTKMTAKRFRKLETLKADIGQWKDDFHPAKGAELCVIGWGSTEGAIREAIQMAAERGIRVAHFHPRILSPLPEKRIAAFLEPIKKVLVVEENFTGQFSHFLKAKFKFDPIEVLKCTGVPFAPDEILEAIVQAHEGLVEKIAVGVNHGHSR